MLLITLLNLFSANINWSWIDLLDVPLSDFNHFSYATSTIKLNSHREIIKDICNFIASRPELGLS